MAGVGASQRSGLGEHRDAEPPRTDRRIKTAGPKTGCWSRSTCGGPSIRARVAARGRPLLHRLCLRPLVPWPASCGRAWRQAPNQRRADPPRGATDASARRVRAPPASSPCGASRRAPASRSSSRHTCGRRPDKWPSARNRSRPCPRPCVCRGRGPPGAGARDDMQIAKMFCLAGTTPGGRTPKHGGRSAGVKGQAGRCCNHDRTLPRSRCRPPAIDLTLREAWAP